MTYDPVRKPRHPERNVNDITKNDVMAPESKRASKFCFEKFIGRRVEDRLFAERVTELWQERSRELIDYRLEVNREAIEVVRYVDDYYVVANSQSQHVRDIMQVIEEIGTDRFEGAEELLNYSNPGDERLRDEFGVENKTEVNGHLICELSRTFQNELTRPFGEREVETAHGSFNITHFCPLDIDPEPEPR